MKAQGMAILPRRAELSPGSLALAPAARQSAGGSARPSLWQRVADWTRGWTRVARERRRLMELDGHILKDIGLSPEEAYREASRPFWDTAGRR